MTITYLLKYFLINKYEVVLSFPLTPPFFKKRLKKVKERKLALQF